MKLEKMLRLRRLARSLLRESDYYKAEADKLFSFIKEHANSVELDVEMWMCSNIDCSHVYSVYLSGRLDIPQPEDGVLTCKWCGSKTTLEDSQRLLETVKKTLKEKNGVLK